MRYIYLILSVVVLIMGFTMSASLDRHNWVDGTGRQLERNREKLRLLKTALVDYRSKTGRYPTNDEGLTPIKSKVYDRYHDHDRSMLVLSPWAEPYIYENRAGLDPKKFADSGATKDTQRLYSIQVDKDVYIWSTAAQAKLPYYGIWRNRLAMIKWAAAALSCLLVVLFVRACRRSSWGKYPTISVLGSLILGLILGVMAAWSAFPRAFATCYEYTSFMPFRRHKQTVDYVSLITKYRNRGIISDKAYAKMMESLENDGLGVPDK